MQLLSAAFAEQSHVSLITISVYTLCIAIYSSVTDLPEDLPLFAQILLIVAQQFTPPKLLHPITTFVVFSYFIITAIRIYSRHRSNTLTNLCQHAS